MPLNEIKKPESVEAALAEFQKLGRANFLEKYGFGRSREYFLSRPSGLFDSKAILGAAHGFEFPEQGPLRPDQFSGGELTVARKLRELGFDVTRTSEPHIERYVSALLTEGSVYTREHLKSILDTSDATINTGVFQPVGFASVLLFITKDKTSDRTQYSDYLDGDTLHWQGQSKGRTDAITVEHRQRGLEIVVFYRDKKYEYAGAGFSYLGKFSYESHSGRAPTNFILQRQLSEIHRAIDSAEQAGEFDPSNIEDARKKTLAAIVRRQGQPAFRQALLAAYEGRCAITGCTVPEALEAAHIVPYKGPETNKVTNGLLLRVDLHTLFDLGLFAINEQGFTVLIGASLRRSDYAQWAGKGMYLPRLASQRPSVNALRQHREKAGLV